MPSNMTRQSEVTKNVDDDDFDDETTYYVCQYQRVMNEVSNAKLHRYHQSLQQTWHAIVFSKLTRVHLSICLQN